MDMEKRPAEYLPAMVRRLRMENLDSVWQEVVESLVTLHLSFPMSEGVLSTKVAVESIEAGLLELREEYGSERCQKFLHEHFENCLANHFALGVRKSTVKDTEMKQKLNDLLTGLENSDDLYRKVASNLRSLDQQMLSASLEDRQIYDKVKKQVHDSLGSSGHFKKRLDD